MKALIEYTNRDRTRDVFGLSIQVDATALGGMPKWFHVNRKNMAQLQKLDVNSSSIKNLTVVSFKYVNTVNIIFYVS